MTNFTSLCKLFYILLFAIVSNNTFVAGSTYTDAADVLKDEMANYTKEMRPVLNQSNSVNVKITPWLRSVNYYEEVTGTLSVILVLTEEWTDEKLQWDPTVYGGINYIIIPQKLVWKPELYLINPAESIAPIGNDAFKIRVSFDGTAVWYTGGNIKTSCSPDMTYFPFDVQTCYLLFAAWGYMASEVNLTTSNTVDLTNLTENGAWSLKDATCKMYEMNLMSIIEIVFKLERKPLYYILTMMFPIMSLCFLNPLVFSLPYESGERVSFCITILLSFAVFTTLTGDVIPRISEPMPLLCIYLFLVQMFSGIITTINGLIFRAYNHNDDDPVPSLLWKIVLLSIKVFGCSCCGKSSIHPKNSSSEDNENLQLENFQESDFKKEDTNSTQDQHKTSWLTVAKAMDRLCFILSYILFASVSMIFLVHTSIRGEF